MVVFLDIKSAFDSVNHDILITKVNENLVSLVWTSTVILKSYLTNREHHSMSREQQCIINGELSSKKIITCGVS